MNSRHTIIHFTRISYTISRFWDFMKGPFKGFISYLNLLWPGNFPQGEKVLETSLLHLVAIYRLASESPTASTLASTTFLLSSVFDFLLTSPSGSFPGFSSGLDKSAAWFFVSCERKAVNECRPLSYFFTIKGCLPQPAAPLSCRPDPVVPRQYIRPANSRRGQSPADTCEIKGGCQWRSPLIALVFGTPTWGRSFWWLLCPLVGSIPRREPCRWTTVINANNFSILFWL